MATYFWVGGTGNWSDATNRGATSSGGTPNAANVPTSADDVVFDASLKLLVRKCLSGCIFKIKTKS
jgi:hypothetical protein